MAVLQFSGGISIMPYHIKSKHPAATWTKEEIELILAQSENKSSKVLQFTLFPKCLCKPSKSYQNIPSRFWRKSQWINKVIKIHLVTTVCAKLHGNPSNFIFLPAMSLFFLFFWFRNVWVWCSDFKCRLLSKLSVLTLNSFNKSTFLLVPPSHFVSLHFYKNQFFPLIKALICRPPVRYDVALFEATISSQMCYSN